MDTSALLQSRGQRVYYWSSLFVANLPVPLFLAFFEIYGDARLGLYLGIALTWIIGLPVSYLSPFLGTSLRWGMSFLALSQLCPVFHAIVGNYALKYASLYKSWPQELSSPLDTFVSGLLLSLIFGGIWLLTGMITGAIILGLSIFHDRNTNSTGK